MCVWNVCTDVKLPWHCWLWFFGFISVSNKQGSVSNKQGAAGNVIVLQPTKTAMTFCDIDLGRWIDVPAISYHFFRQWQPAKPSTGMSFVFQFPWWNLLLLNLPQNFDVNRFQYTVRFSQSKLLPISSDGTVAFCKDKDFFYIGFLAQSSIFSCQTLRDCLCTWDAFHNSNSQWCFWASVCVYVLWGFFPSLLQQHRSEPLLKPWFMLSTFWVSWNL